MADDVPQLDSRALIVDQTAQDAFLKPEEKAKLWSLVVLGYYPTGSSTAFETLVSTGKLGIIKDFDLVRELQPTLSQSSRFRRTKRGTFNVYADG